MTRFADSVGYRADRLSSLNDERREYSPWLLKLLFALPPSHSPLGFSSWRGAFQQRSFALAFQTLQSIIKPRLGLTIWAWCNVAGLDCAAKFVERLPDDLPGVLRIASFVFVVNRQLLVGFVAIPWISNRISLKFTRQVEITLAFRNPC
jgi:hypothetical protein